MGSTLQSRLVSRNVTVNGHRTSLRLEQDVWDALEEVCGREGLSLHEVCTHIENRRSGSSRTAAVRASYWVISAKRHPIQGMSGPVTATLAPVKKAASRVWA